MADLMVANSSYQSGDQDSASTLVNNVSATDAQQMNGAASAAVQIEAILGRGSDLKGSTADLVARLAVNLTNAGGLKNPITSDASTWTANRPLVATSATSIGQRNLMPFGVIAPYGGASAPTHWLMCDGTAVSRTTYVDLFAAISTAYGVGDGSTTFNLPDLRGRVPMGVDGSANRITSASTDGANADTLGGAGGTETHTLVAGETPAHNHTGATFSAGTEGIVGGGASGAPTGNNYGTSSFGSGGAHSNTQPWQTVNFIIYAGV